MSKVDYSSRVGAVYFNDGADGSVTVLKNKERSIERKHDVSYMVDSSRQTTRDDGDENDDEAALLFEKSSYFKLPYLTLVLFGRRFLSFTRHEYDNLSPIVRRLADSLMAVEKEH